MKPFITQEECWEFFADNMAPFTSSPSSALRNDFSGDAMQEEHAKEMITTFLAALVTSLQKVDTYKVLR